MGIIISLGVSEAVVLIWGLVCYFRERKIDEIEERALMRSLSWPSGDADDSRRATTRESRVI